MHSFSEKDRQWMQLALSLAQEAALRQEVPVGAVVVKDDTVIGTGFNRREELHSPLAHAELEAIAQATQKLQNWRLIDCTLYVTLEPCLMCAGALHQSRIGRVVFGTRDPKAGALGSLYAAHEDQRLNHRYRVDEGLLADEASQLLKEFFKVRR